MPPDRFNIRVYGIWIRGTEVLISRECSGDLAFTKFPGGGLEFGEGIVACLQREFREELEVEINYHELFYINEAPLISAFNAQEQLISIYFLVTSADEPTTILKTETRWQKPYTMQAEWIPISSVNKSIFYFPIDKIVGEKIQEKYNDFYLKM